MHGCTMFNVKGRAGTDLVRIFQVLALYWSSPESGDLWYKSGQIKWTIFFPSEGSWIQLDIFHLRLGLALEQLLGFGV